MEVEVIPKFTKEQFLQGTDPFEYVHKFKENKLRHLQIINAVSEVAKSYGIRNFQKMYKSYENLVDSQNGILDENVTDFEGQEQELVCGEWFADDYGVVGRDRQGFEIVACSHPITITQRLVNIDTGIEKLKVSFKKNKQWRHIIADKKTLASASQILQLADYGVAVNSENSKYLVRYLSDIESKNYDSIEELNAVGRLGWIEDYGFSPYVEDLVFDGNLSYKHFFEAVSQKGKFSEWIDFVRGIRSQKCTITNLMLSASFSSVLVSICGALPFFVHLWGGTEAGKSVALMTAASVWANPVIGKYIHTFNGTAVAQELSATFVNSLPLMLDELQIQKDRKDFDNMIYFLCEGVGRARGQKTGGLQQIGSWQNCILTTGEMPISNGNSGSGAVNRVIEIDCKNHKLFNDPVGVVSFIKKHYGHAGKTFVELLSDPDNADYARGVQKEIYSQLVAGESTEKQAMSASIILAADRLVEEWIFKDGIRLNISDIEPYLSTKREVSAHERALDFLYDFVSMNTNHFDNGRNADYLTGEVWGAIDGRYIYIVNAAFNRIMQNEGYNPTAFLSWAKEMGIIKAQGGKNTKTKRILGNVCRCVWLEVNSEFEEIVTDDNPFEKEKNVTPVTPVTPI